MSDPSIIPVRMRDGEEEPHPKAVERAEEEAAATAAARRQAIQGMWIMVLATIACLTGLWRDQHVMVLGGFLGVAFGAEKLSWEQIAEIIPKVKK